MFKQVRLTSLCDDCTGYLVELKRELCFGKARNSLKHPLGHLARKWYAQMSLKALAAHNFALRHVFSSAWMIWRIRGLQAYLQPSDWLKEGTLLGQLDHQLLPRFHVTTMPACLSADMP